MALMTADEYRERLRDGREVWYKGRRIEDVTLDPDIRVCVDTMAVDYELPEHEELRHLGVVRDPETGEEQSRYYHIPRNGDDLLLHQELIVAGTRLGDGFIPFAKDIGADVLSAIEITARRLGSQDYIDRIGAYGRYLRQNDLAVVAAVTDVKGDRMLRPSDPGQAHEDYYVHVVERRPDGIVVRGAKTHISGAAYAHEMFVIPCRTMGEADKDYALAFAVPCNQPGVRQILRPFHSRISSLEFPNSRPVRVHTESLVIFDDVFVPWERVFLDGEWQASNTLVHSFALLHRRTGVAYRIPMSEQLVGVAQAIAEYNGVAKAPHVVEKLTDMVIYLETLKGLARASCLDYTLHDGVAVPSPMLTNLAKFHFADRYHDMVKIIEDLAGGVLVTATTYADWQRDELRPDIEKYLGGKAGIPTEARLRMLDLIRRLTRSELETIVLQGEGSLMAQRMTIFFEARRILQNAKALVEEIAQVPREA